MFSHKWANEMKRRQRGFIQRCLGETAQPTAIEYKFVRRIQQGKKPGHVAAQLVQKLAQGHFLSTLGGTLPEGASSFIPTPQGATPCYSQVLWLLDIALALVLKCNRGRYAGII